MITLEPLTLTDNFDLDLLRELIHDNVIPECYDPAYVTQADLEAFHADMKAIPVSIPTDAEILAMAQSQGIACLPF
jgi:hypothetical protein